MGKLSDQIKIGFQKNWWLQKRNKGATIIIFVLPILMAAAAGFSMRTGLGSVKRTLVQTQAFSWDIFASVTSLNDCVDKKNMTSCTIAVLARPLGDSNRTDVIINNLRSLARYQKMDLPIQYYQSQDEMIQGYANNSVWAGIELEELKEGFNYTIRLAEDYLPGSTDSDEMFYTSGFVGLQSFIERAILMTTVPSHNVSSFYSLSKYPYWKQDKPPNSLANSFASMINYSYMLAFLVPLVQIVKEKQSKLKEFMKIAGLNEIAYWLSWLCLQLLFVVGPLILSSCSIYLVIGAELQTPFFAFFLLNVGYVVSSIMFSFFIPVVMSSAQLASVTATLWFTILGLVSTFLIDTGFIVQLAASFIAPMGFYCALMKMFVNEASNSPWTSVWFSTEEMTTGNFAAILFVDAFIYSFLLWYLSNVLPQDQGIRKPFYFCFLPRYWKATPKRLAEEESLLVNDDGNDYELREGIEQLNSNQPVGIQMRKLNKIYPGKQDEKVVAVNNLSMDIGTNQIMALLGHNGAGKSTTISILTGMTSATSGEVLINGLDINENIDNLRKVMGYCPQKDLLFDELTGEQHLRIFAKLRGVDDDVLDHVVIRALENVDLIEKKDTIVKEYSGGMKRRLSLAIATIGPVKVVFLDEPTSGLDPTSRAHLWDTLKKFKEGKTIILTTHFMEEADVLGDRIAIIANGKLKCYGTPLFLKQRFGIGYYLNIAKAEFFSMSNFTKFIKDLYPSASLAQENDGDLTILLPNSESALLLNLLKALEQEKKEPVHNLGIESYGISMTSLEDVFLKITADENEHSDEPKPSLRLGEQSIDVDEDEPDHIVGSAAALDAAEDTKQSSFVTKMNALVKARVIFQMRSWKMLLVFLLLPTLTLLLMNVIFTAQQRLNGNQLDSKTDAVPESFSFVEYLPFTLPFYETFNRNQISTFINATHSLSPDPNGIKFLEFSSSRFIEEYLTDLLNSTNNATIDPEFGFGALAFFGMNTTSDYYIINFYYNQVRHGSLPALINMFHSAVLAIHAGPEVAKTYLMVNSNPFPQASGNILLVIRESTNAYVIALELCALGVLLAKKVLSERLHQTRLLINVTGTPPFIYWISNLIVDGTLTFISVFMACVIGFIVQLGGLTPDLLPSIALIAVGFTLSYTSWAYVCTFMFNKVETLQKWLGLINMVTLLPSGLIFLPAPYNILSNLTPPSAVATAFVHLANLKDQSRVFNQENYLAFLDPNLGICWTLLFFLGQSLFFFSILVIVDSLHNYHKRQSLYDDALPPRDDIDMDDDVRVEKDRVWNDQHNPKDVVKALNIYKVYNKDVTAVKGVTLGIQNNICFGLLGPNGAGKTTTIAMLTAQTSTSHGDILLHNMSTHNISVSKLYRQIALNCCLQSNKALMGFLTVREQLELYVKLRAGLTSAQVSHHVTSLLHRTGLSKYEKKLTKTLSGGNKRKLSLAIAMAWGSKIILLDEPSSGMDPLARRQLWHEIRYVKNNNTCVLLTTHSMDEAEAICDRIAIMVKGQIRCIGSPQHLKHKFGSGYRLLLTYSQDKQLEIHNFVTSHFAGCKLLEAMDGFRMYDVGAVGNNLAGLFALVEENKQALSISNWAISQTSLKQVFLHLTKQQNEQPLFS